MGKSVLIVIIFHNERSFDDTLDSIHSVREIEYKNYDILVVNNGTHNGYGRTIALKYPGVLYLHAEKNLGFAGGNNLGIEYGLAKGYEFFLLLNNDVSVAPDFLNHLIAKLDEDETIGMVGPKIFYYAKRDKLWAAGGYIIKWRALVGALREHNYPQKGGEVDYLPGACILVKREVIERVVKLPEEYFFAYEEADFALKVKRAGYKIVLEPKAHIWHKVGLSSKTTPEFIYNSYRNRLLFFKRNFIFPLDLLLIITLVIAKIAQSKTNKKLSIEALFDHVKYKNIQEAHLVKVKQKYNR